MKNLEYTQVATFIWRRSPKTTKNYNSNWRARAYNQRILVLTEVAIKKVRLIIKSI